MHTRQILYPVTIENETMSLSPLKRVSELKVTSNNLSCDSICVLETCSHNILNSQIRFHVWIPFLTSGKRYLSKI